MKHPQIRPGKNQIHTPAPTAVYRAGWDEVFGKNKQPEGRVERVPVSESKLVTFVHSSGRQMILREGLTLRQLVQHGINHLDLSGGPLREGWWKVANAAQGGENHDE